MCIQAWKCNDCCEVRRVSPNLEHPNLPMKLTMAIISLFDSWSHQRVPKEKPNCQRLTPMVEGCKLNKKKPLTRGCNNLKIIRDDSQERGCNNLKLIRDDSQDILYFCILEPTLRHFTTMPYFSSAVNFIKKRKLTH